MKQSVNTLEKKVRNLEKRKSKLDAIRAKAAAGETLEKEQQDAIKHYDEVITNLDFARELQKSLNVIAADSEKALKKQAKREKQERAASDLKRVVDILQVQTTLDSLGSDTVRDHFKTGKYGAVVLTEDNLTQLDELFQLISPSREGSENFSAKLTTAAEHLVSLLEARDRPVVGSTYKELYELITLVNDCGYFERAREAEETVEEPAAEEKEEAAEEGVVEETPVSLPPSSETPFDNVTEQEQENSAALRQTPEMEDNSLSHSQVMQTVPQESSDAFYVQNATQPASFQAAQAARTRPLDEIVSSVQGTFNFLQESVIDIDSPHMDPAVVAAQPMMRPPSAPQTQAGTMLPPAGFPSAPFPDTTVDQQQPASRDADAQDPLSLSQQSLSQSNLDFGGPSPAFGQAGLSHSQNLAGVGDVLFQSSVEDSSASSTVPQQHSHTMLGQGMGAGETASQFELPPSIPMPPSQSQDGSQLTGQEKKFTMNASAPVFRSMYSQPSAMQNMQQGGQQAPPPSQQQTAQQSQHQNQPDARPSTLPPSTVSEFPSAPNFAQAAGDFSQTGNNFQSGGFNRGGRGGGPNSFRGGQRGGGRGGSTTNGNAMQNGFNARPQSGNRGGRGGSSFQGFPPRNDYRPDGYQGFNSNGICGNEHLLQP
nr:hypothetical protein BaRGS_016314 [Batillaria attramentaria]